MKTTFVLLTAAAAVLLTACLPSVHPFYTPKDVISDARIEGEWSARGDEDPGGWKFEADGDGTYQLTVTDKEGRLGHFRATLFQLKGEHFLDLYPAECNFDPQQAELVAFSVIPGHLLVHVSQLEPTIRMAFCDFDWLENFLEAHPDALPHLNEDGTVLTASTRQLQRFVLKHLKTGELFSDYGELDRQDAATKE